MSRFSKVDHSYCMISKPGCLDVLCGRGRGFFEHPGNRRMLSIVAQHKHEYQMASKIKKSAITQKVFELVMNSEEGGRPRFLKKANGAKETAETAWYELDEKEILKKISHTLREQKDIVKFHEFSSSESSKDSTFESTVTCTVVVDEIKSLNAAEGLISRRPENTSEESHADVGCLRETPSYRDSILSIDIDLFTLGDDKHSSASFMDGLEFGRSFSNNTISDDETSSPSDADECASGPDRGDETSLERDYTRVFDELPLCFEHEPLFCGTEMDTLLRDSFNTEGSLSEVII